MTSHGAGLPPLLQAGAGIPTDPEEEKGHMTKSGSFGALSDRQGHAAAGRNSAADGAEQGQSDELQGEGAAEDLDKPGGEATAAGSPKWQSGLGLRKLAREFGEKSTEQLENARKVWEMLRSGQPQGGGGGGHRQEDTHTQNQQDQPGKSCEDAEASSRRSSGPADPRAGPPSPMKSPWSPLTRPMVDAFKEGVLKPGQVMGKRLAEVWDIHDLFDDVKQQRDYIKANLKQFEKNPAIDEEDENLSGEVSPLPEAGAVEDARAATASGAATQKGAEAGGAGSSPEEKEKEKNRLTVV